MASTDGATRGKPKRAAIYARISEDPEGREAGVERQVKDAQVVIDREGWELGPWAPFIDNDISASTKSTARRPAYEHMMELVASGDIDGIAFYSNSRLTRRPREYEDIIELVQRTGLQLASAVSGRADLSTADGRQMARMMAAVDAAEAERISERVSRAFLQRREQGQPNPSSRAFGYEKGGVVVKQDEAVLLREAASRILVDGWSLGELVRDWNERKIPTIREAGGWSRTTLKRALTNPRAAGHITLDGEVLGRGNFDAILTREEQLEIQARLTARRKGTAVFDGRKHWLAGFLVCGKCGKPMKVNGLYDSDGALRKDAYIVCSRSQHGCGGLKRNLAHVTEYVDSIIRVRIEQAVPSEDSSVDDGMAAQIAALQTRLSEIEEDIADLKARFNAGEVRFKDYNPDLAALRNLQDMTEQSLANLSANKVVNDDIDLLAIWEDGSIEEKRTVVEWAIDHIKLHPIGKVGPIRAKELLPTATQIVPRRAS